MKATAPHQRGPADDEALAALRTLRAWLAADAASPPTSVTHYDSKHLPPGIASPRAYRARARGIPEARRVGRDVVVPVDAWDRTLERPAATRPRAPASAAAEADDVDELLAAGGVRLRVVRDARNVGAARGPR